MKLNRINLLVLPLLIGLVSLTAACDSLLNWRGVDVSPTPQFKTIHPATLTAISAAAGESGTPAPDPFGIPLSDLDGIELEFWYVWDLDEPGEGMNAIVDKFNQENQYGIKVTAVDQGLTLDPMDSVEASFEDGLLPNVMINDAVYLAGWYEAGLTVDLRTYIDHPAVGFSVADWRDYFPGIIDAFKLSNNVRPGIPFTQDMQILFYNQTWGEELGFNTPPTSSDELFEQICAAAEDYQGQVDEPGDIGGGLIVYPDSANVLSWIYAYDGTILDSNQDGYDFSSPEVLEFAKDWIELGQKECGFMISGYPNPMAQEIEFEKFNQRKALVIMNSSRNLDQIALKANHTGRPDDWIMIPFIGPEGSQAVTSRVQAGVIFRSSAEEKLASWLFLKYLTSPEVQMDWVQYSGFYPTRKDTLYLLRKYRADNPDWALGVNLLKYGRIEPLHPSWEIVRQAVGDAFESLFGQNPEDIKDLLLTLDQTAADLVRYSQD
jgi:ABC-type glycerol-3-phosphate transport system substrate-binding protein